MEPQLYHDFARLEDSHWWFLGRQAVVLAVLRRYLPRGEHRRILDVGCGTGGLLAQLETFGEVEGLEASQEALTYCRRRVGERVPLHLGSIPEGLPPGPFDLVTAFDVLEHLEDPVFALREIRARLKPGGIFACTVPAFQFLWSGHDKANHHFRRYTRGLLTEQLARAGFQLLHASYFNSLLFPAIAAVRLFQKLFPEQEGASDLGEVARPVNALLRETLSLERLWVPRVPVPVGVSLVALCQVQPGD